ncbi:MAG: Zn-ribbon domain-containing OB-fold protein [Pseudomonadota bacterium]|nr:Zn-ribbon domain-containing OB-fold protein [Pseudomonadota bacterium]
MKPIPRPSTTTRPFWDGLNERKVQIQRCEGCDTWVFYPRTRCPSCLSDQLIWREVSGRGVLYTYTLARQPTAPHFADETPQQLAVVELDEGVRMTSTLVNVEPTDIVIGMRLRPYFDQVTDAVTLLRYQPG